MDTHTVLLFSIPINPILIGLIFVTYITPLLSFSSFAEGNSTTSDHNTLLVYRYCGAQKIDDPTTIHSLFDRLIAQSSESKFNKTTISSTHTDLNTSSLRGKFQCRGDLSNQECNHCIKSVPRLTNTSLCGNSVSARVQLFGCHLQYEAVGHETPAPEVIHKICEQEAVEEQPGGAAGTTGIGGSAGEGAFEVARDKAFEELETEVTVHHGFFSYRDENIYALTQCEAGLDEYGCRDCVHKAIEIAREECEHSFSGQIFMDECFISYEYNPHHDDLDRDHPVPSDSHPDGGPGFSASGKLVAIAVGGAALLGFLAIVCKKTFQKKDDCR